MRKNLRLISQSALLFGATSAVALTTSAQPAPEEGEAPAEPAPSTEEAAPEAPLTETEAAAEPPAPAPEAAPVAAQPTPAAEADLSTQTEVNLAPPPPSTPPPAEPESWFSRPSLTTSVGEGNKQISLTLYGFLQVDAIYDTTRSYSEDIGPHLVARSDTFEGTVGRTQFTAKNTRIGLRLDGPRLAGLEPTLVVEGDFFGNQPDHPNDGTESAYYDSPTFRLRHGYINLENPVIDVLVGQTYDLFGWGNYFQPATAEFLGLPSMVFSRPVQARFTKSFGEESAVGLDIAAAATRPAQRDSEVPDLRGGLRLKVNKFKGLRTPGNGDPEALPLAVGVSGAVRQFNVDAFTPPPTQTSNAVTGWGLSVDALLPVIPTKDKNDRGNALTLVGSYVMGTGIGDLMGATGGAEFPTLPNEAQANPPPEYHANVDPGMVSFDSQGVLSTIDWQGFLAGLQYYLPPSGRVIIALNYSQAHSENMSDLFPQGGAEIELLGRVADSQRYMDATLFWDATNALRLGISGSYTTVRYLDGDEPNNIRGRGQLMYSF